MSDLKEEIRKAIEKNLPKEAGDLLRRRLDEADKTDQALKLANETNATLKKRAGELEELRISRDDLESREATLKVDRAKLDAEAIRAEVTMLQKELEYVKESRVEIKDLVNSLFRNLEFRRNVMGTVPFQNQQGYVEQGNKDEDHKETLE